jgi:hypothetical protein
MDSIEKVIQTITLPLVLPDEVFIAIGSGYVLTVESLLGSLPSELSNFIDLSKTTFCKRRGNQTRYFLHLEGKSFLEVVLEEKSIVEMNKLDVK